MIWLFQQQPYKYLQLAEQVLILWSFIFSLVDLIGSDGVEFFYVWLSEAPYNRLENKVLPLVLLLHPSLKLHELVAALCFFGRLQGLHALIWKIIQTIGRGGWQIAARIREVHRAVIVASRWACFLRRLGRLFHLLLEAAEFWIVVRGYEDIHLGSIFNEYSCFS